MHKDSKVLISTHLNERLEQAILAYHTRTLERRVVANGIIQTLPSDETVAKEHIKTLLAQGYTLAKNDSGISYLTQGLMGGSPLDALIMKLDMKPAAQRSIFISYQWAQKDVAKKLQIVFEAKGFLVIRDEDHLENNVYLPGFMKIIGHRNLDYVLPILSKNYFESKACMYEANQIMRRFYWQETLLPYMVESQEAKADIYKTITPYITHWEKELEKEKDSKEKESIENIKRNLRPFTEAIKVKIRVLENELIATEYGAFFKIMEETENEYMRFSLFKEIEELLRVASINEGIKDYDEAKGNFESAIKRIKEIKHLVGINVMFGKVYGLYGEYLLRQKTETQKGEEYLKIGMSFGYCRSFRHGLSVNPGDVSKFLRFVVEGEQEQAEDMLRANKDLALASADVTDLSKRAFSNITGFQYAVWALDWHMWKMIQKYLVTEAASQQIEEAKQGSWIASYGHHANWDELIHALQTCIDLYKSSKKEEGDQVWIRQVGGSQFSLPVHVINEYCHPTRSFYPCPDYTVASVLPRSRAIKIYVNGSGLKDDGGEWFACSVTGQLLGKTFAVGRGNLTGKSYGQHIVHGGDIPSHDRMSLTALYNARINQRNALIADLTSKSNPAFTTKK